jgi:hypothetical protein
LHFNSALWDSNFLAAKDIGFYEARLSFIMLLNYSNKTTSNVFQKQYSLRYSKKYGLIAIVGTEVVVLVYMNNRGNKI